MSEIDTAATSVRFSELAKTAVAAVAGEVGMKLSENERDFAAVLWMDGYKAGADAVLAMVQARP